MDDNAIDVEGRNGEDPPRERIKNARRISPDERHARDFTQPSRAQHVRVSHSRLETNIPGNKKKRKRKKTQIE